MAGSRVLVCVVAVALATASAVSASPTDSGTTSPATAFNLGALGYSSSLAFYGQQGSQTLTLPVGLGLVPTALTATVELPPNLLRATLSVVQGDREISRVEVPSIPDATVTLPLAGAVVVDNSITVTLRSYVVPPEGVCVYDPTNPLRLIDVSIDFGGVEAPPTVVADFLPPILQRLTVFIPPAPTRAESDAAVAVSTAVVSRYGQQALHVSVQAAALGQPLPPPGPFERQIAIAEGHDAGVSIQNNGGFPSLLIAGPATDLANQVRLLTSNLSRLAVSSKAVAGPIRSSAQLSPNATTLRDLGNPGESAVALTNPSVTVGLDQTRLGRPSRGIRVHLQGSYTPLPPNYGGQVVVSVGSQVIDRWAAEPGGAIDRWVEVPDRLLQRFTTLTVAVNAAGNTGGCGLSQPITLTIDGNSPVQSIPAKPPVPAGFQSLPQALMPLIQVGIGTDAFADTARATLLLAELQRLSAIPLTTRVVPLAEAVSSRIPAVLIASNGWHDAKIALPVTRPRDGVTEVKGIDGNDNDTTVTLDPSVNFGSLQTVVDGDRSVVVATSTADPSLLDAVLAWLDADPQRWPLLNGNALVGLPNREPIALTIGVLAAPNHDGGHHRTALWWLAGVGLLAVAAAAVWVMLRARARRPDS